MPGKPVQVDLPLNVWTDGFMCCPCGRGEYRLCKKCPYTVCSVHGKKKTKHPKRIGLVFE